MCQSFPTQALFSFLTSGKIVPKPPRLCISLLQQLPLFFSTSQDVAGHPHLAPLASPSQSCQDGEGWEAREPAQAAALLFTAVCGSWSCSSWADWPRTSLADLLSEGKVQQQPQKSSLRVPPWAAPPLSSLGNAQGNNLSEQTSCVLTVGIYLFMSPDLGLNSLPRWSLDKLDLPNWNPGLLGHGSPASPAGTDLGSVSACQSLPVQQHPTVPAEKIPVIILINLWVLSLQVRLYSHSLSNIIRA